MTLTSLTTAVAYLGDGATTAFAVPFPFFDASELEVIERVAASGAETTKNLLTHYSVTGGNGADGTVTALAPPAATVEWHIRRRTARTQQIDYVENDPFPAATHERALDRAAARAQEQDEALGRALTVPKTDPAANLVLPPKAQRAGRYPSFDAEGNVETVNAVVDVTLVASIAGSVVTVGTISAAVVGLAGIGSQVVTLAASIAELTGLHAALDALLAVQAKLDAVETVADSIGDVTTVAGNVADVTSFARVYYGPSATPPALRRNGTALQGGDLYFDTTYRLMRLWNAADAAWQAVGAGSLARDLRSGNGVRTDFDLSVTPTSADQVFAYVDGLHVKRDDFTLDDDGIVFDTPPASGTNNVEIVVFRPQTLVPDVAGLAERVAALEYIAPEVALSVAPAQAEIGAAVATATLSIDSSRPDLPTAISGAATATVAPGDSSAGVSGPFSSDSTFTATVTDPDPPPGKPDSDAASATLHFRWRRHWGVSAAASLGSAGILGLANSELATAFGPKSVVYDAGGGAYPYYAYPAAWGTPANVTVGGLAFTDFTVNDITHTNASGGTTSYRVLRFGHLQNGSAIGVTWA